MDGVAPHQRRPRHEAHPRHETDRTTWTDHMVRATGLAPGNLAGLEGSALQRQVEALQDQVQALTAQVEALMARAAR